MDALRRLALFDGVPDASLAQLWAQGQPQAVARGEVAFRQGAPADHCLLVVQGRLKAWAQQGDREQPVSDVWPGELVGEAALFDPAGTRTATLRAWEDSACLRLTAVDIRALSSSPALAALQRHMLVTAARRLRTTHHALRKQLRAAPETAGPAAPAPAAGGSAWSRLARFFGAVG